LLISLTLPLLALQYVNSVYFQSTEQVEQREIPTLEEMLTARDGEYYDFLFRRAITDAAVGNFQTAG
jgi:hypothetical protein